MSRKKILTEEPEEKEEIEWDKKKIAVATITLGVLLIGGLFFKHFLLDSKNPSQQEVKGINTMLESNSQSNSSDLPSVNSIKQGIQETLGNLQKQAQSISLSEVASSSPQVRDVIQQLQQLPKLPQSVAKQTCEQLCGKL